MISLVASVMFTMGISAVIRLYSIPGIKPMAAGMIIKKVSGVTILWASLKVLA